MRYAARARASRTVFDDPLRAASSPISGTAPQGARPARGPEPERDQPVEPVRGAFPRLGAQDGQGGGEDPPHAGVGATLHRAFERVGDPARPDLTGACEPSELSAEPVGGQVAASGQGEHRRVGPLGAPLRDPCARQSAMASANGPSPAVRSMNAPRTVPGP